MTVEVTIKVHAGEPYKVRVDRVECGAHNHYTTLEPGQSVSIALWHDCHIELTEAGQATKEKSND